MEVIYAPKAIEHLNYWKKSGNKAIQENPFDGIGKPEPLKYELSGSWSRRINEEHRIVYEIHDDGIIVILEIQSLKGHY
ncbi:toxin YoeB [Pedobacter sp. AK013]|uniref:Txe/YoeB family addiction module toxin n=1 Tax=Pedobacter sp. AK013 TaxID=2723071 RepID=UPI001616CACD|nr:Txe/YoeB family addiction module toxin [Pedobacter sp. AK013]MBB6239410.1 toxin YoeB [Pedobacter sp. AK013]